MGSGWIAVGFLLSALLAGAMSTEDAVLVSLPAGVALGGLVLYGLRLWPVVLVLALLVGLFDPAFEALAGSQGALLAMASVHAVSITAGAAVAAVLLRGTQFRSSLDRVRDVLLFGAIAVVVGPLVSGTLEAMGQAAVAPGNVVEVGPFVRRAVFSQGSGILIVAPFMFAFLGDSSREGWPEGWPVELTFGLTLAGAAAVALFGGLLSPELATAALLLPLPFTVWGGYRFALHGVSSVTLTVGLTAVWRSASGAGPFAAGAGSEDAVWVFVLTLGFAGLLLWALVSVNRRALIRFRAVFQTSSDGMILFRPDQVFDCNPAAVRLFGTRGRERLLSLPFNELSAPRQEGDQPAWSVLERRLKEADAKGSARFEWKLRRLDGTIFPSEMAVSPVEVEGGPGYLGIIRDISEQRAQEQELERTLGQTESVSRAKSEFLANVSHEIRSALNANLGFARLLSKDETLGERQRERVEAILRSGSKILELVEDTLEMSRADSGHISVWSTTFDLQALLESLEETYRIGAEKKGLRFVMHVADDVPRYVNTDRTKLRQALLCLLGNALKFTFEGEVAFEVRGAGAAEDGDGIRLRFEVRDTGIGLEAAMLDNLFDASGPSDRLVDNPPSLPTARAFARLLGGDIRAESAVGEGSRFLLEIDARAGGVDDVRGAVEKRVTGLASDQTPPRILVVDDREENRTLLSSLLTRVGFEVRDASDGEEGLRVFGAWNPDLVLMDRQMPGIDGPEATRRIRASEEGAGTPVVMVTAGGFGESRADLLRHGANGLVRVPYRDSDVLDEIARHLGVRYAYEA